MYESARKGQEVAIKPRSIHIKELEILSINMPYITFKVACSKGTYIRSLAFDIGKALNSGAWLCKLQRTKIGEYSIDNAIDITNFEEMMISS